MTRVIFSTLMVAGAVLTFAGAAEQAGSPKPEPEAKIYCPVVGLPDSKSPCGCPGGYCSLKPSDRVSLEHKGAKLRFCCSQCLKIYKDAPANFAVTVHHQLIATKQAKQVKCPLCGGKSDAASTVNVGGIDIACCSAECAKKVNDAGKTERLALVFGDQAFARGFVVVAEKK